MIKKKIWRRSFVISLGLGTVALALMSCLKLTKENFPEKPNIILIMADDLGYECLSCNGSISYQTPNLDNLSKEGVRFTQCYSTPLCTPSRVQLLTGMYNFRNYTEFGTMPAGQTTFAHLLKDAGYSTCIGGKWQLAGKYEGASYRGAGTYPNQNGFDEYCLWQVDRFGSRYWGPLLNTNGNYHQYEETEYGPDIVCNFILNYIDRHQSDPFLIYYPMILTHDPFVPTPHSSFTDEEKHKNNPVYFKDMVEYTDDIIGRIVNKLDETNLRKNTLIVFIGDNGTHRSINTKFENTVIQGDKGKTTTAGTHVPMIARWRNLSGENLVCEDLVDFTDFLPTLLEAAGIGEYEIPHEDGRSFLPQIKGESGNPREWIYCYYNPKWGKHEKTIYAQTKYWKLYANGKFYNLLEDQEEQKPINRKELTPKIVNIKNRLQKVLDEMKQGTIN